MVTCTIEGCDRKNNARGLCTAHYQQAQRNGTLSQHKTKGYRANGVVLFEKQCVKCKWVYPNNLEFFKPDASRTDKLSNMCRTCYGELNKTRRAERRQRILAHYGNKCICCGETIPEFLAIDHINGGGRQHRMSISQHFYEWIEKHNYPDTLRILCHNCNSARGYYGFCPHERSN